MIVESSKHFSRKELQCSASGQCQMQSELLDRLELVRQEYGNPMRISSAYRDPELNPIENKKMKPGEHGRGNAVDILCFGEEAVKILKLLIKHGFSGLGISQKGQFEKRFLHADLRQNPTIWSY